MILTDIQTKLAEQLLLTIINRERPIEYNELASRINPQIHCSKLENILRWSQNSAKNWDYPCFQQK